MDDELNLTDFVAQLIASSARLDLAEAEFKRQLADDQDLRHAYKAYCEENGHSLRNGFTALADEIYAGRDEVWETLQDFDEEDE